MRRLEQEKRGWWNASKGFLFFLVVFGEITLDHARTDTRLPPLSGVGKPQKA